MRIDLDELGAGAVGAPAFEGVGFNADTFGGVGSRKQLGCCGHFGMATELARLDALQKTYYGVPVFNRPKGVAPLRLSGAAQKLVSNCTALAATLPA